MKKEQKIFTIILIFYWFGIFVATHIPVPNWTRQMQMSDKTMHFVAYMILGMLFWLSVQFDVKANWKKFRLWLIPAVVILYGAVDEISQHFMHRSTDIIDFASNVLGLAAAMAIVSFVSAYHIVMILVTICPLFAPSIVRSNLIEQGSLPEYAAYITGFAIVTASWIIYLSSIFNFSLRKIKNLPIFFAPPALTVLTVKIYAQLTEKPFSKAAILSAFISIFLTILIWRTLRRDKAVI